MHLSRFGRRTGDLVLCAVPVCDAVRQVVHRVVIMPQKKNPDAAELIRAKMGRIFGANVALMTGDEGPAADLFQGHARRQRTGL